MRMTPDGPPPETPAAPNPRRRKRRRAFALVTLVGYLLLAMFGGCADFFLLHPTHDFVATPGASRMEIPVPGRQPVEVFTRRVNVPAGAEPAAYLLIFDGNGGRAEHAIYWGDSVTGGRAVEIWAMNFPGFGGSPGSAKLAGIAPAAVATFDALAARASGKPVIVWGASIGSTAAIHLAARRAPAGLILTNPPPLRQLLLGHYGWWNLWLAAIPTALGVPADLDSVANGKQAKCPAVFVMADADSIVPPKYHDMVFDAYAGEKRAVHLPGADHNTAPAGAARDKLDDELGWLWQKVGR